MPDSPHNADDSGQPGSQPKRRRIPGACDVCKRRKIRCDSAQMPGNRCSHCIQLGCECTHKEVIKMLGPAKGYVESLESRLEKMDKLLAKLLPLGVDINKEIDRMETDSVETVETVATPAISEPESLPRNDDDDPNILLAIQFRKEHRFYGKSSGLRLLQTALELKQEYTGDPAPIKQLRPMRRQELWEHPSWASYNPEDEETIPNYIYPDEDLVPSLIDAYFIQINPFLPLLHRPTFERLVAEGVHFLDPMFGAVYLLVCAHGARYSEDPRVLANGTDCPRSAGWRWFEQVHVYNRPLARKTTLYELQMIALHVLFGYTTGIPQGDWNAVGLALRMAQDVGAHRKRRKNDETPNAETELWKRAFWVILSLERIICTISGRACALQEEDLDLDLPLECDDEYWDCGFQQPPNKPSSIAYFRHFLGLMDILAYAMRLIYSIKRPRHNFGRPSSDQEIIAELDSTMNKWMDAVPKHLKWNPTCENKLFLKQSAALHAVYYHLQIYIHRPFIPSPRNPIPGVFPSLAICTNAARSCCHVLETFSRLSSLPLAHLQVAAFTSAVILLLNIWSGKRSGYAPNPLKYMEDVQRCLEILKASERRWTSAGRYWDILTELASAGELSIPNRQLSSSNLKRQRETLETDTTATSEPLPLTSSYHSRKIAGNQRVSNNQSSNLGSQQPAYFPLPMYSNELGRLPIYGQHSFSDMFVTQDPIPPPLCISEQPSTTVVNPGPFRHDLYDVKPTSSESLPRYENAHSWAPEQFPITLENSLPSSFDENDAPAMYFQDMPAMDNDIMNMWSTAPTSLELDDWNIYILSMGQVTQSRSQ